MSGNGLLDIKEYTTESVYTCNHCGNFTYNETSDIEKHIDICLKNVKNKNCFTCKHFKVRLEPTNYNNKYFSEKIVKEIGYNCKGLCNKFDVLEELDEMALLTLDYDDCWEHYEDTIIETIKSNDYIKYEEILQMIDMEEKEDREWLHNFHMKMIESKNGDEFQEWCDLELARLEEKKNIN